jgi:hypothetical protein
MVHAHCVSSRRDFPVTCLIYFLRDKSTQILFVLCCLHMQRMGFPLSFPYNALFHECCTKLVLEVPYLGSRLTMSAMPLLLLLGSCSCYGRSKRAAAVPCCAIKSTY